MAYTVYIFIGLSQYLKHGIISLWPKMQEGVIVSKMMKVKSKITKIARLQRVNTYGKNT